ncbi:hypothetical protein B9Q04_10815, partial [Candidatus Marsarchaeota G2 archaeon BE_D]
DPEDFERHAYIIGSTGSGKTNLLRVLVDGLRRSDPESVIVVLDPHGDLAPSVAAKYEGSVYFHPTRSPFTMNPLRLPSFGEAEQAKLLGISNLMEIFEKVFWLGESAVYVRYILQNAMHALYSMTAEPTFTDLYRMILLLRNGEIDASWLAGASGADVSAVKEKVEFFKNLNSNSFVSALSRLELLATNGVLRKVFGGQDVSDDIFMKPGSTVCVDTGITDVGDEASYLIMAGFMMKVWYLALAGLELREEGEYIYGYRRVPQDSRPFSSGCDALRSEEVRPPPDHGPPAHRAAHKTGAGVGLQQHRGQIRHAFAGRRCREAEIGGQGLPEGA